MSIFFSLIVNQLKYFLFFNNINKQKKWKCLNMTNSERRKLFLHVSFNLISMICVFWSIWVIAERASLEISNRLGWKFWIKMVVSYFYFIIFFLRSYLLI